MDITTKPKKKKGATLLAIVDINSISLEKGTCSPSYFLSRTYFFFYFYLFFFLRKFSLLFFVLL